MGTKIGSSDIRGALNESIGLANLAIPGAGKVEFGNSLEQLGGVASKIAVDTQMRHNELIVQDGLSKFRNARRSVLLGDAQGAPGALNVAGMDAVGLTERSGVELRKQFDKISGGLDNHVQKNAFQRHASRVIASTLDTIALHEADTKEKARVGKLTANYQEELTNKAATNPLAFISTPETRDTEGISRADERAYIQEITEDYVHAQSPFLDDEDVTTIARGEVAKWAHQAILNHLTSSGPEAIADGRKFLNEYKGRWSAQQIAQVQSAVNHQIGLQVMLNVVPSVMADAEAGDYTHDKVRMRDEAVEMFKSRYANPERGTGNEAPAEYIDEVARRMTAEIAFVDGAVKEMEEATDDALAGNFLQAVSDPNATAASVEAAYREAWSKSDPTRPGMFKLLDQYKGNFEETGTQFAAVTDKIGYQAQGFTVHQLRNTSEVDVKMLASHMNEKEGQKFIDRARTARGSNAPDQTSDIVKAINRARAEQKEDPLKNDSWEMGIQIVQMQEMIDGFNASGSEAPPDITELTNMARIGVLSSNTPNSVLGEGSVATIFEFIANPTALEVTDAGDMAFVKMSLAFLRTSPARFGSFVRENQVDDKNGLLLALSRDPGLVAALIRDGLSQPQGASTILGAIASGEREELRVEESAAIAAITRRNDQAYDRQLKHNAATGLDDDAFMQKIAGEVDGG